MIHLIRDLYLDKDNLQFILKKRSLVTKEDSKNLGQETFISLGYYPKLEQLLQSAVMKKLKEEDFKSLSDMKVRQEQLITEFKESAKVFKLALETFDK